MPKQLILAVDDDAATLGILEDYFEDTKSEFLSTSSHNHFEKLLKRNPDFFFLNPLIFDLFPKNSFLKFLEDRKAKSFFLAYEDWRAGGTAMPLNVPKISKPIKPIDFEKELFRVCEPEFPETMRVLTIDDEMDVCAGIKDFLLLCNGPYFVVDFALNGLEGFEKIEQFKPDVVILDIKMPVKSGYDLYREIQQRYRELRIIFLTATVSADEVQAIRKLGAPEFVEKGSDRGNFPELLSLIKKQWLFS